MNKYKKLRLIIQVGYLMIGFGIAIVAWSFSENVETHATISSIAIGYFLFGFIIMGLGISLKRKENDT